MSVPPIAPPKQERSRRTLERLLAAAEQMLDEGTFDGATIAEIARRARSSVGSFYARFSSKDALLEALVDRVHDEMLAAAEKLEREAPADAGLETRVRTYVAMVVRWTRWRHGVLRARVVHHLAKGEAVPASHIARTRRLADAIRRYFAPCLAEIRAPDAPRALDFALDLVDATVAGRLILRGPGLEGFGTPDEQALVRDLTRAVLGYLGLPPPPER